VLFCASGTVTMLVCSVNVNGSTRVAAAAIARCVFVAQLPSRSASCEQQS